MTSTSAGLAGANTALPDPKLVPRSISFTIPGDPSVTVKAVEDGAGNIDFTDTVNNTGNQHSDAGGLFFDINDAKLSGLTVAGTQVTYSRVSDDNVINLAPNAPGINMEGGGRQPFDVGIAFGDVSSTTFVLSDPAHNLTLDDLAFDIFGARPTASSEKITAIAPAAPTAIGDSTAKTLEDVPITIPISMLATDANPGATLTITQVTQPKYGKVTIASDGSSLTYDPGAGPNPLDYEVGSVLTGDQVTFQYAVADSLGGTDSASVTVTETPVADAPNVSVKVLAPHSGDPVTEIRLLVTSTSGDFGTASAGSDFIQSLGLNLTGNVTSGFTITDTDGLLSGTTITTTGKPGQFIDEIDITAPSSQSITDNLAITAVNAETEGTGSPATASAIKNQTIGIDHASLSQNLDFKTSAPQSIWDTGAAFDKTFSTGFLGVNASTHGSTAAHTPIFGATIASAGGSIHFKAGFEADLHITAGDISADLPFKVGLDSTYNKTTDTLQIVPSEAQLGGGSFTEHGPGGSLTFGLDLGLAASAHATLLGVGPSFSTTIGSFTHPVFTKTFKSSTVAVPIPLPAGLTLTLAFPTVNENGSNPAPGTISSKGTSQDFVNLSADLVAVASIIALGTDVTDLTVASVFSIDLLDLFVGAGLNLVQAFDLSASGLTPTLTLADGTTQPFSLTSPTTITNVSSHGLNPDGTVGYTVGLTPDATLHNATSIGANLTAEIQALGLSIGPIGFTVLDKKTAIQLGTFPPLFDKTFALGGFNSQNVSATV